MLISGQPKSRTLLGTVLPFPALPAAATSDTSQPLLSVGVSLLWPVSYTQACSLQLPLSHDWI